ncbi:MAG TPA: acetylglutamate kinase [Actinomycetota bacterium]|nr:acetylglutamate kinase [Actinomycetota bacterium]
MSPGTRSWSEAQKKSAVLVEALPYIQKWSGKNVVIKVGGEIADNPETLAGFATDLTLLKYVGMRPILVHGGGNQISQAMRDLGLEPRFIGGYRVTDEQTVAVVRKAMMEVNEAITAAIDSNGGDAAPLAGDEDGLLQTKQLLGPGGEDLGLVGEVVDVDPSQLYRVLLKDCIPVIAPLGCGADGSTHNINADLAAAAIAVRVEAQKIVFLTNTEGLYRDLGDESSLISETRVPQLKAMLDGGHLSKGMIPKISGVVQALECGVPQAHILDGRQPHCLLVEIFTDEGSGTMVLP